MKISNLAGFLLLICLSSGIVAAPISVDGEWLSKHLNDKNLVLIDMSTDSTQYQRFHLPGAAHLPYSALVQKNRKGVSLRVSDQRLAVILGFFGITPDKHVVIYDDMGGLDAGRLFWELERIGHQQVSVLDGGLVKWILDGRKVDNKLVQTIKSTYVIATDGRDNEAGLAKIKTAIEDGVVLLDVRSPEEYKGDKRQKRSGHIPGAKLWTWNQAVDFDKGFTAQDDEKLLASLKDLGVTPDMPVIAYCRSGHRAAQTYYTLRKLGFDKISLYDGSTAEWTGNPSLPLNMGMQP